MKPLLPLLFLLYFFSSGIAQNNVVPTKKMILGDTSYYYNWISQIAQKIELKDLRVTNNNFYFRFWRPYEGQAVEIWMDSTNMIHGQISNYIFQESSKKHISKDTLFDKILLTTAQAALVYKLIDSCDIISLKENYIIDYRKDSADEASHKFEYAEENKDTINRGKYKYDRISYVFEYADKKTYFLNSSIPVLFDTIPEKKRISDFPKYLYDTLNLSKINDDFILKLPAKNNRTYYLGDRQTMIFSHSFSIFYKGDIKMPFGFAVAYYQSRVHKIHIGLKGLVQYKADFKGNQDFSFNFFKYDLYLKKPKNYSNALNFGFRYRDLVWVGKENKFKNYQLSFINFFEKFIYIQIGVNYLNDNYTEKIGGLFSLTKRIQKPQLTLEAKSYIYKNQFDYSFGAYKTIAIKSPRVYDTYCFYTNLGLEFENFYDYNSLSLSVYIPLQY